MLDEGGTLLQFEEAMTGQHAGSCLCGEVRYAVTGDFDRFYLCHCSRCRKGTGSAHAANLFSAGASLSWLAGQASIGRFTLPGTRHARCFCTRCGAPLPLAGPDGVVVPAGSLDTGVDRRSDGNIFMDSRAGWDDDLASAPSYGAFPPPLSGEQ